MAVAVELRPVAKGKSGRPKTSLRNDAVARVDAGVIAKAKMVATARKITLAEYLSDLLKAPVDRDFVRLMRDMEAGPK